MASNSSIPSTSTLNRIPKAIVDRKLKDRNGRVVNAKTTIPIHQTSNIDHTEIVYTQSMKGVPQNLFRNNGSKFSATIEQKSFNKLLSCSIRFELTHNGEQDIVCVPPTYWFNRIEFRASDGSKHLNMLYDDNMHFALCTSDYSVYGSTKQLMGIAKNDPEYWKVNLKSNDVKYLPLMGSWVESADLWFRNIEGDIVVDFYPRNNIQIDGVPSEINVQSMEFVIQTEELSEQELQMQDRFHNSIASETSFLDIVPVNFYNHKLQAQTTTKFELDAVNGDVAFLVMYVKPQVSGSNVVNPLSLGKDAKIDLLTPGSKSILGSGTGVDLHYLKNMVLPTHFHNDFANEHDNIVIVPFCTSVSKAFFGVKSGSMYLDGSRYYLSVTPDESFETGNYDVTIYAYKFATLLNNKGKLSIHQS